MAANHHGQPWNRKVVLALPQKDVINKDARDLYAPGAYDRIRNGLEATFKEVEDKEFVEYGPVEAQIQRADKALKPVEISYRILANRLAHPPTGHDWHGAGHRLEDRRKLCDGCPTRWGLSIFALTRMDELWSRHPMRARSPATPLKSW